MEYALDTELGTIYVDKSEYDDVKLRHTGAYGDDWMYDDHGNKLMFVEDTSIPDLTTGSVRIDVRKVEAYTPTPYEQALLEADGLQEVAKIVDEMRKTLR